MHNYSKNIEPENDLSYRLAKGVIFAQKGSTLYLIRKNPLATITLNSIWKPVLDLMSQGEFIKFTEIYTYVNTDPDKTEKYLNSLVRKGFMESWGYRSLSDYPFVTIIIPVRNRPDEISRCLASLSELDYPSDKKEIIVVDDASRDNTADVVSGFPVRLIKNSSRMHASHSRNLAAKEAKGDILAFIDSDCTADRLWLKGLVPAFNDEINGVAGGKVDSWFDKKALDKYEKISSSLNMGPRSKSSKEEGSFFYLPTCNLLVKKEIFLKLDGFKADMTVGEDVDFCWRLKNMGYEIEYLPTGIVFHKHRNKTTAFFKRRFQYGTSEPFLREKHPDRIKQMYYMPLTMLLWLIVLIALLTGCYFLLGLCGIILVIDTHAKWKQAKEKELPIKYSQVLSAVLRGYFVSIYYWCAFFSRYYLVMAFIFFPVFPIICLILFINHIIVSLCEFFLKKAPSNIFSFVYFFSIDQLAYQIGVWYGCFRYLTFNPVNPKISRWIS
jgi:mycofactocin system glycosyltransferase